MTTAIIRESSRVRFLEEMVSDRESEVQALRQKLQRTKDRLEFYRTPEGKARLAREHFNLVLPGEKIYRISIESGDVLRDGLP